MTSPTFGRGTDLLRIRLPFLPFRRRAFKRVAAAQLAAGAYAEADAVLSRGLAAFPGDFDLLYDYALSANDRGLYAEALERWKAARAAREGNAMCWCGVAANLRALEQTDLAEATIAQALDRFRDEPLVLLEAARIAMERCAFADALARWTAAIEACGPHPDCLFGRADALLRLGRLDDTADALEVLRTHAPDHPGHDDLARLLRQKAQHASDALPLPPLSSTREGTPIAPDALFARFESLGDNCEFGLVQRYNHIEPLGLFRFSSTSAPGLTNAISRGLEDCFTADDFEILVVDDMYYDCRSRTYGDFRYHTEVAIAAMDEDALLRREHTKVTYLKKRFLADIAAGEKIFVRKGGLYADTLALFRAMRARAPATLLSVNLADADHPAGSVERIEDGLYKGYIGRFAPYGNAHDIDMIGWGAVCCATLSLLESEPERQARYQIEQTVVYRMGHLWAVTPLCDVVEVPEPSFPGCPTKRLVLARTTERSDALVLTRYIDLDLPPRAPVVFSTWIWIPRSFKGTFVDVCFTNAPRSFLGAADLSVRDAWQRIWTSVRLPKAQTKAAASLRVTGLEGDTLFVGAWRLEAGSLPNDWEFAPFVERQFEDDGHRNLHRAAANSR